jgi:hypothetical protein
MVWFDWFAASVARQRDESGTLALAAIEHADAGIRMGVVRDVSHDNATVLWPRALSPGACLSVALACPHDTPLVQLGVTHASGRVAVGRFYRYRCRWLEQVPRDDGLHAQLVDLHAAHARATDASPAGARWSWRLRLGRAKRHRIHLPVRIEAGGAPLVTVSRDLSATGLSVIAGRRAAIGDGLTLEIAAPEQRWRGHAIVARCEHLADGATGPIYLWGLRFDALDTQRDIGRFREWITA